MMARVDFLDADQLDDGSRDLLARPINIFRALAHRPEPLRGFQTIGEWVRWRSGIDGRVRELVILTVGLVGRSRYEVAHHTRIAKDFGATDDDLDRLFAWYERGSPLAPRDLIAVSTARELSESAALTDPSWAALVDEFGPDDALDIVITASYYGMAVRVLGALAVDNEEDYESDAWRYDELIVRLSEEGGP